MQGRFRATASFRQEQGQPPFQPGHPGTGTRKKPDKRVSPPPAATAPQVRCQRDSGPEQIGKTAGKRHRDGRSDKGRRAEWDRCQHAGKKVARIVGLAETPPMLPASPCARTGMTTRSRRLMANTPVTIITIRKAGSGTGYPSRPRLRQGRWPSLIYQKAGHYTSCPARNRTAPVLMHRQRR